MPSTQTKDLKRRAMADIAKVQEVLRRWDPIGLNELLPSDEYDSYAPHIVSLVSENPSHEKLAEHLSDIQTQRIGIPETRERNLEIARQIVEALAYRRAP